MTNSISSSTVSARVLGAAVLSIVALAGMIPAFAYAATYAYVNQAGEVRTVEASTSSAAITTAPGIHIHSGVMLLTSANDAIVGDQVPTSI